MRTGCRPKGWPLRSAPPRRPLVTRPRAQTVEEHEAAGGDTWGGGAEGDEAEDRYLVPAYPYSATVVAVMAAADAIGSTLLRLRNPLPGTPRPLHWTARARACK